MRVLTWVENLMHGDFSIAGAIGIRSYESFDEGDGIA